MLAREAKTPFDNEDWIFELKWDGYRAIAEAGARPVRLYSRYGNSFSESYPLVVRELEEMNMDAVLDGEIVVLDENGRPDFELLQNYGNNPANPIVYYVFDILFLGSRNLCSLPLAERKKILKDTLKKNEVVRYSDHVKKNGIAFFNEAQKVNIEGIMAKRAGSEYYPGRRTNEWLKIKHHKTAEAIITGFTAPSGGRKFFGALVLGMYEGDKLKYIGHTGSGFTGISLQEVAGLLRPLVREDSPFSEPVKTNMPVTWVKPELVCEVKYSEWTNDSKLRHPIFLRLRPDKKPAEVIMNEQQPVENNSMEEKTKTSSKRKNTSPAGEVKNGDKKVYSFGKMHVHTTNRSKIFWPDEGITKGDVIDYYINISDYVMPYLEGRPQSLKRNPNGILDEGFFQKDAGREAPGWVRTRKIYSESAGKDIDYIICDNQATLTYLNNLGCIEINPWHSTQEALDNPDYMVIDIDPSEKNTFEQVIESAQAIHEVLEKAKAPNFCKTSGATGLHVYVPIGKKYTYDQVKDFAQLVCMLAHEQLSDFASLERNLKARGPKIYLDHLQNRRGQTIACAYSLRPQPGATVSAPLEWKEVKPGLSPLQFTIHNIHDRLKKKGDIFTGILGKGIDLVKCLEELDK